MANFLARRFLSSLISVIGATIAIFVLIQFHSDPRELFIPDSGYGITQEQWENLGERMGLNDPLWKQYINWMGNTLRGDLGVSLARDRAVTDLIRGKIGATVQLAVGGWIGVSRVWNPSLIFFSFLFSNGLIGIFEKKNKLKQTG